MLRKDENHMTFRTIPGVKVIVRWTNPKTELMIILPRKQDITHDATPTPQEHTRC